jgi:hypothetical protein
MGINMTEQEKKLLELGNFASDFRNTDEQREKAFKKLRSLARKLKVNLKYAFIK